MVQGEQAVCSCCFSLSALRGVIVLYYNRECAAQSENTGKDGFGTVWNWESWLNADSQMHYWRELEQEKSMRLLSSKAKWDSWWNLKTILEIAFHRHRMIQWNWGESSEDFSAFALVAGENLLVMSGKGDLLEKVTPSLAVADTCSHHPKAFWCWSSGMGWDKTS